MHLLVVDNGACVSFAAAMGRSNIFESVGYFAPWQADFVNTRERAVGFGYSEFEREYDLFSCLERYDAFAFPDLYWSGMQEWLRRGGYPVWGSGATEELELNRIGLLAVMRELEMKVPNNPRVAAGVSKALRLAADGDIVKITGYARGDGETAHHDSHLPLWADNLRHATGPFAETMNILLQTPFADRFEPGADMIFVGGERLSPFLVGYEKKDAAYLGHVTSTMPEYFADIERGLKHMLPATYSNFVSIEALERTLVDITLRQPCPPGASQLVLYSNLPLIVHEAIAEERAVPHPKPTAKYCCEIVVKTEAPDSYARIVVPKEYRERVAVRRSFIYEGAVWFAPETAEAVKEVANVVGLGDNAGAAIADALYVAKSLTLSEDLHYDKNIGDELLKTVEQGVRKGIAF